jgi:lactaldehyde reductase
MAFSNVGLGCVHSMAHPLGARFDIAHGVANALLLPIVMEFNMPACEEKYCDIAKAMGVDTTGMTVSEGAKAAVEAVQRLNGLEPTGQVGPITWNAIIDLYEDYT